VIPTLASHIGSTLADKAPASPGARTAERRFEHCCDRVEQRGTQGANRRYRVDR
jgi:hypothetical protein